MKEIHDIIKAFVRAQQEGKPAALATVVHVDGSSYRRPGARMLITSDGQLTGAISGGCLEGDALRKALLAMTTQKTMLVTYDTNEEDDAKLGMGLGCNGIIHVLIEPVIPSNPGNPIELLKLLVSKRQKGVLVTLFHLKDKRDIQPGTCLLYLEDGSIYGRENLLNREDALTAEHRFNNMLDNDARHSMQNNTSSFKNYISEKYNLTSFIQMIKPVISLIIIGAGNDVKPLVELAAILGCQTTVIDGRPAYAKQERFPRAGRVIVQKAENVLNELVTDEQTVFVLMTHNYNYDMIALRTLIKTEPAYIGMIGPRKKLERMLDDLKGEGINLTSQQLSRLHTPAGLDIGAETPEEIALSIITEIHAILAGKQGAYLRDKGDVIHLRSSSAIEEVRLHSTS